MSPRHIPKILRNLGVLAAMSLLLTVLAPVGASADERIQDVNLRTPFDCGQVWNANTRTNHNPQLSVDFQRSDAMGQNTRSSAPGTVTTVEDLGDESYGKYIEIDHGSGVSTLYAHLDSQAVSVGDSVETGTVIGTVGTTGGSTGPHLHYEQKVDGTVVEAVLNGLEILYYGNTEVTSSTGC
ncbi:M23 family metallopeptidase [Nocardiopsis sp. HNM0947]|uniref:M23 family metallopeptidase n=1 Tax=Nocardiopsis coralli TaxID=2772213 RepID=A0ABR9P383_9ACTN|nr:M23 family metallopeptidase [Nocardiopsis coralli]MBE2998307.1 M23 family metallopeptidase [Nocardiopsis coralli]